MAKQVECPRCKEVFRATDEDEIVAKIQQHARERHNGHQPPTEQILNKVVEAP